MRFLLLQKYLYIFSYNTYYNYFVNIFFRKKYKAKYYNLCFFNFIIFKVFTYSNNCRHQFHF